MEERKRVKMVKGLTSQRVNTIVRTQMGSAERGQTSECKPVVHNERDYQCGIEGI